MNVEILEKFFDKALHRCEPILSLEFLSDDILYYVEVSPVHNSLMLTASNKDLKPLFEFNMSCNRFTIESELNGVEKLLVHLNDQCKNEFSINKQNESYWISVEL